MCTCDPVNAVPSSRCRPLTTSDVNHECPSAVRSPSHNGQSLSTGLFLRSLHLMVQGTTASTHLRADEAGPLAPPAPLDGNPSTSFQLYNLNPRISPRRVLEYVLQDGQG